MMSRVARGVGGFVSGLNRALKGMFARKYTFIFIPDVTGKFYRRVVSSAAAHLSIAAVFIFFVGFSIFAFDALKNSGDLSELERLRELNGQQKVQIGHISYQLKEMEARLERLDRFDRKLRLIAELETDPRADAQTAAGGPAHDSFNLTSSDSDRYTAAALEAIESDIDRLTQRADRQEASFLKLDEFFNEQGSLLAHTPSIWPVRGWVTSGFGYRRSPFTGLREMHEGLDIAAQRKAPVISPAAGVVVAAEFRKGYGNVIEIDHGYGIVTKYGHSSVNIAKVGQKVKRGDVIALVGSTGRSTGPHLHYEVLAHGAPVNPTGYIFED